MSELPKPGEVWGVPDKPAHWLFCVDVMPDGSEIRWNTFTGYMSCPMSPESFEKQVAESGFVRIFPKDTP